jgi:hypothetical protein
VSDKRIPKPGEAWTLKGTGCTSEVINVYPDCLTYDHVGWTKATTLSDFLDRYTPPEPTVVQSAHVMHDAKGFFAVDNRPEGWPGKVVGTIAAMSDGTFRFEAVS